uniref:Uncharacterized protein n=1 Tax=Magnetococcus massalia (strain MO-1) TaxID=451514 RepID=A0A1S7LJJ1_MAGMO|nr:protein of unknown function [Candidatus Magnetococcus massalia]
MFRGAEGCENLGNNPAIETRLIEMSIRKAPTFQ